MKGLGKILFGGLLGAVFGYFASPTRARRVHDALLGKKALRGVAPSPRAAAPSLYAPPVPTAAFPPPVSVEVEPSPVWVEAEPIMTAPPVFVEPEPIIEPEIVAVPEPVAEPEIVAVPEPVAEPEIAAVPEPESIAEPEPAAQVEPELLVEPIAEPIAEPEPEPEPIAEAPAEPEPEVADETAEPFAPVLDELETEEESPPAAQVEEEIQPAETAVVAPLDLKARIEETRRRIQQELERPFVTEVAEDQGLPSGGSPWSGAPLAVEEPEAVQEATQDPVEVAPDWASPPPAETTPVAPAWVAPDWPAAPAEDMHAADPPVEFVEPVTESVASSLEPFEPVAEMPALITEMIGLDQASEADPVSEEVSEFDREAMRRRIEATRSRLKAKAFDAMLSGESSLLARDTAGALEGSALKVEVPVDSEVDQTIESTLTEEDL